MSQCTTTARNHPPCYFAWCCALLAACALAGCGEKKEEPKKTAGASSTVKKTDTGAAKTKNSASAKKTPASSGPAEWGTLKGRFVYDGKAPEPTAFAVGGGAAVAPCCVGGCPKDDSLVVSQDGGLANVAVYLRTGKDDKIAIHAEYEKDAAKAAEIDNAGCMFSPHLVAMRTSQPLVIKNSDKIAHNSKLTPVKNAETNPLIQPGGSLTYKFSKGAETVPATIACSIHTWMKGYVLATDTPYFAVTRDDGTFEIANVPAGKELEFQLWHERSGNLGGVSVAGQTADGRGRITIKVKPGMNDLGEIKVPPVKLASK